MIKISNLAFSYGKQEVLRNIDLELREGCIYGLLGENGVGKTTLLTLLCGLKKVAVGSIDTDGFNPFDRKPEFLQNQYYLPDEPYASPLSAEDYSITYGAFWPSYDHARFIEIMHFFENDPSRRMNRMSAGQLKKTYISFALATNAKHIFMDEPTNGLDIPSKSQFRTAIMRYTREDSIIVISTHQVRDLENVIDPVIILDCRDVLLNASIEEISSKLVFDNGNERRPEAFFCEATPNGLIQVLPNVDGRESKVNIEALFNAVHNHKEVMKAMFTK